MILLGSFDAVSENILGTVKFCHSAFLTNKSNLTMKFAALETEPETETFSSEFKCCLLRFTLSPFQWCGRKGTKI